MGLGLGITLKLYTSVEKRLKLKVRKFWWINPTFVEVTGEKIVGEAFLILNSAVTLRKSDILLTNIYIYVFLEIRFSICVDHIYGRGGSFKPSWFLYQMF